MSRSNFCGGKQLGGIRGGEIEPGVAQACTAHMATQRGRTACPQHRHPPCARPIAPVCSCHSGRPRRPPRRGTAPAPHRAQGHLGGRTREEKRPHRIQCLVMRCPPLVFSPPGHGLATTGCSSESSDRTAS